MTTDPGMTPRIMLCDAEPQLLRAAELKFQRAGFDVVCAVDGEDAWSQLQTQRPHVLVTDCQMPRLDGLGLIRRLHEHASLRELPVIMLTAKGFALSSQELRETYGVHAVLAKPFTPRALLQRVEQVLAAEDLLPIQLPCTS